MQLVANTASWWTLGRIHCGHGCLERVRRGLCSQGGNRGSSRSGKKDVAVTVIQSLDSQWNRLFQGRDTSLGNGCGIAHRVLATGCSLCCESFNQLGVILQMQAGTDRKSTRLNSSHLG